MALTSVQEMIDLASQEFVDFRVDDLEANGRDETYLSGLINEATDTVMSRLEGRYEQAALNASALVRRWTTIVALFFLSQRRDNSAQFLSEFERVMDELELVATGVILIPGVGTRADLSPSVSNFTVDSRYTISKVRVIEQISSGGSHSDRKTAEVFPTDWI